jgi:hypothetical protein
MPAPTPAAPVVVHGRIKTIFADDLPDYDIVVELDAAGPCGSFFFHIQRSSPLFHELYGILLTAFSGGKVVDLVVTGCLYDGTRNLVGHGAALT